MILKGAFLLFSLIFAAPSDIQISILSQGNTGKSNSFSAENAVVKNEEELKKTWDDLGIEGETPDIDFSKELAVFIVPKIKPGSSVEISRVEKKSDDVVEVGFVVRPPAKGVELKGLHISPYIAAKLYPIDVKRVNVRFAQDFPLPPVPANSGIDQTPYYTNILREYENVAVSKFFPLDKGNRWTYKIESKDKTGEETYSILSITQDGWSVFDSFFGQRGIAMRIDPSGDIHVSLNKSARTFYTLDVQRSFNNAEFSTPAGKFNDLMIVTVPVNDKFWFKDVYAKGLGLIYHEHKSPKSNVKYVLLNAEVRGKKYP